MRIRTGMSLLEILIATALFSVMLVMVIEAMMNLRGLASTVEDMDILEEQAARAQTEISKDFANSGWFYCWPGANGRRFYPQIHLSDQQSWQLLAVSPEPSVNIPLFNSTLPRTASVTQNRATLLGDAIVFARLQPEGMPLSNRPINPGAAVVDFRQSQPMRLDQFANARPVQSLVINLDTTDQSELTSVVWETTPAEIATGLKAPELYNDHRVRLFCYRVVPDPVTGRGQLIRYYSNPTSGSRDNDDAWEIDKVLATDVVGMRIYSFEMAGWYAGSNTNRDFTVNDAAGLTNNQIRFFIDFARNLHQLDSDTAIDVRDRGATTAAGEDQRASTVKTLQFTVSLRSITNSLDQ